MRSMKILSTWSICGMFLTIFFLFVATGYSSTVRTFDSLSLEEYTWRLENYYGWPNEITMGYYADYAEAYATMREFVNTQGGQWASSYNTNGDRVMEIYCWRAFDNNTLYFFPYVTEKGTLTTSYVPENTERNDKNLGGSTNSCEIFR